jgi:hypothetical protein
LVWKLFIIIPWARNTAIGSKALYFNNAYDNTAVGYLTLQNNTTGSYNVGLGSETMFDNTLNNTAVGYGFKINIRLNNTAMDIILWVLILLEVEILLLDITLYLAILLVRIMIWCSSRTNIYRNRSDRRGCNRLHRGVIMLS